MKRVREIYLRLMFPWIGIGSLVWFLIRVVPKPSRAAYPCMRVAAPLASTFVLWILGICSSLFFIKRARAYFRQSQHATAVVCVVLAGIAGGIFISSPNSPIYGATKANTPVGEAKGANPGRVVWVHDSAATPWRGLGDGHWWESNHTIQPVVDQMMSRSLHALSGKTTDAAAWDTLFRYYNVTHGRGNKGYTTGEKIAIKINLTFCNYFPAFCCVDSMTYSLNKKLDYMNTSPQMVRALLRQLVNVVGVNQSDISVGDPTAYYPNEYYDSCHAEFPDVHYIDHAGKIGRTKVEFSTVPVYFSCRPAGVTQDFVPRHYAEASYLVNLANMKSHLGAGVTLCAKNHFGSLIRLPTDSGYYNLHQSLAFMTPQTGSYRAQVDFMGHAHLGGKTLLCLIDGLYAGNHNYDTVPHTWDVPPFNGGWTSSLFASQDPVAIESVLFDLFQLDKDPYQFPKIPGAEDYLNEAALAYNPPSGTFYDPNHETATQRLPSLGVFEHWNDSVDRQYSRNLGTGNGIELVFIDGASSRIRAVSRPVSARLAYSVRVQASRIVELSVPGSSMISLALFDAKGRQVQRVFDGYLTAGNFQLNLACSKMLPSGFYKLMLNRNENGTMKPAASCSAVLLGK